MHTLCETNFDLVVQQYRQKLTNAAYHLCGDRETALDIVQDTLVDAYRAFGNLRETEKVGAWLYTILRRKVIDYRRKKRDVVELTEDSMVVDSDAADLLIKGIIVEQMSRLSEQDREILAGKYLIGLTYRELAESLGIKENAVRVRALRAKTRLGEILRGVGIDVPKGK